LSVLRGTLSAVARQIPPQLLELAEQQCGIVTKRQAIALGMTRSVIASHVRYGRWQRLHPGVYATFTGRPSRPAELWAAVLSAGLGAMLSYQTAAELAGLIKRPSPLIHVTVPADRRVARRPGIVVHRSEREAAARHPVKQPPQTRIEETVLDLAGAARTIDDAHAWITRCLGSRLTTQGKLHQALAVRSKIRWRAELTELLTPDAAGFHSVLERRYHSNVERPHGLPAAQRQARFSSGGHNEYRDALYEAYRTAIELDGDATHGADTKWWDVRRDNAAAADGIATLRYGWFDVTQTPCRVAAEVAQVLADRGFTGAHACSSGCPVGELTAQRRPPTGIP
jgi:predicted transcriptional regulator of viral defense system